jgi:hypothetical protein
MPVTFTPEEWLTKLEMALDARLPLIELYENYYDGKHETEFATEKFNQAFGDLFETFSDNWCGLIVDAAAERLRVQGFGFGQDTADDDAWSMWQMNALDAESLKAHTDAIKCGVSYIMVDPSAPEGVTSPKITVEHPSQVIVAHDRADKRIRLAALKRWRELDGTDRCTLFLPNRIYRFRTRMAGAGQSIMGLYLPPSVERATGGRWELDETFENRLGIVPVIPLTNNPGSLKTEGVSDLKPAIALNNAANKFFMDMMVASEFAAYPQRVILGITVPDDPVTGKPNVDLVASVSRTWVFENPEGRVEQFAAADLANYVTALDTTIQHIAAQTRTPPHYLLAKMVNLSADALLAAETGLVHRVKRKHIDFSDSWEEAMRLAFRIRGDQRRGSMMEAETLWSNPETHSPAMISNALVQERTLGVPFETLWSKLGYSPQQIKDFKTLTGLPDRPPPGATTTNAVQPAGVISTNPADRPGTTP